ncbi:MAG: S8 family serine peptidase [Chthoniobacterales bacterium]|nr:S8 family serine peptidase [Chthoniobacterales bacterium]
MKKLPLLLLLSACALAPLRVSAMIEGDEKEGYKESSDLKKTLQKNTNETLLEDQKAAAERVNNPAANNNTEIKFEAFVKKEEIIQDSTMKSSPNADPQPNSSLVDADEESENEKENLWDLDILEQRTQEAREIVADLGGKGPAISEQALRDLYHTWSQRYQRYQKALQDLQQQSEIGIAGEQIEDRLGELVKVSQKAQEALETSLRSITQELTRAAGTKKWDPLIDEKKTTQKERTQEQEKELLEQETTTALKQFEKLLNDGSSLLYRDRPQVSLTSYQEKYQSFFNELRTVAEKQKKTCKDQEQREETPSVLHAWEKVLEMIPSLEKNHREWKETFSAKEKAIVDANLMIAWSSFQEGMAYARGEKEAALWEESAEISKHRAAALRAGDEEQAERLKKPAYSLGGWEKWPGAAYAYGKAREARAWGDELGNQEAALWEESAAILKEYAAALGRGDETQAERLGKQAYTLGGWENWPGAAYAYGKAREARAQGDELGNKEAALWEESAAIWKEQSAALAKGDEPQAERLKKQAYALGGYADWPGAAYAYGKAREARARGDELGNKEAALWEESAEISKHRAAALRAGDEEQAERLKKQAYALGGWKNCPGAAYAYGKAREARARGDELGNKEAALWEESAAIWKEQAAALREGDEKQAELLSKQANALSNSTSTVSPLYSYEKAREARAQGDELGNKEATLWEDIAEIYKKQAAAVKGKDEKQAELLSKQANALSNSTSTVSPLYSYEKAREARAKEDELGEKEAALWEKSAEIWRERSAALGRGDEEQAVKLRKQAYALGGWDSSKGAAYAYGKAREARARKDELGKKEAALWEESAAIYKEQASALAKGDEKQAGRLSKQAYALSNSTSTVSPLYCYGKAREAKAQGDELGEKEAALWEEAAEISKEYAAALGREDGTPRAEQLEKQTLALGGGADSPGAAYAYGKAREARARGDELGEKEAALWEESAAILKEHAAALARGDGSEAEQLKKQAYALGGCGGWPGAAYAHGKAREARAKGDEFGEKEAAALWEELAAIYKEQAAVLRAGDEKQAGRLEKQALALGGWGKSPGAAYAYRKAREARAQGDELGEKEAALWEKSAEIWQDQAAAVKGKDEKQAGRLEKQALALGGWGNWPGAAYAYRKAREARARGDELGDKEAALWEESAEIWKEYAAALGRGDENQAERLKKQAYALGCGWADLPGAAYAYGKAREARARGDELGEKEAALWEESAAILKEHAAALGRGDENQAERLKKQAYALGYGWADLLGAAYAYGKAREARAKGDEFGEKEAAALWEEAAEIWKEYAAALGRGDENQAERLKKQAYVLGGGWANSPGAAYAYGNAREARARKDELGDKEAALWEESAEIWKEQASVLAKGDENQAVRLKKQALKIEEQIYLLKQHQLEKDVAIFKAASAAKAYYDANEEIGKALYSTEPHKRDSLEEHLKVALDAQNIETNSQGDSASELNLKEELYRLQNEAAKKTSSAMTAYRQALETGEEGDLLEAFKKAVATYDSWEEVKNYCNELNHLGSLWKDSLEVAKCELAAWTRALNQFDPQHSESLRLPPERDLQEFPFSTLCKTFNTSESGIQKEIRILNTMFKYPLIRAEEKLNRPITYMVANQLRLIQGKENLEKFCNNEEVKKLGKPIRKSEDSYLFEFNNELIGSQFPPDSLERLLIEHQVDYVPNYMVSLEMDSGSNSQKKINFGNIFKNFVDNLSVDSKEKARSANNTKKELMASESKEKKLPLLEKGEEEPWNLKHIHAPEAWEILKKAEEEGRLNNDEITIAFIDSGVDISKFERPGQEGGKIIYRCNYTDKKLNDDVSDGAGHGTACIEIASSVLGHQKNLSKKVNFIACKITKDRSFDTDSFLQALQWACEKGAKIINISAGWHRDSTLNKKERHDNLKEKLNNLPDSQYDDKDIEEAIEENDKKWNKDDKELDKVLFNSLNKKIIIVNSAGNLGLDISQANNQHYPSHYEYKYENIIVVGATTKEGKLLRRSNYGRKVHLGAPGAEVFSRLLERNVSGTSYATPHVSGSIGVMEQLKELNPKTSLVNSTDPIEDDQERYIFGGALNLEDALLGKTTKWPERYKKKTHKQIEDTLKNNCTETDDTYQNMMQIATVGQQFNNGCHAHSDKNNVFTSVPAVASTAAQNFQEVASAVAQDFKALFVDAFSSRAPIEKGGTD